MASSIKNIEISKVGATIEMLVVNAVKPNVPECYALTGIKSVVPTYNLGIGRNGIVNPTTYPFTDQLMITVNFHNEHANPPIVFDIQTVSNQAGWTPNTAGLLQAKIDICGWITSVAPGGGGGALATEATLVSVLNAVVASDQDIEVLLVRDTVTLIVYKQITDWTTGVPVISYTDVNGAPFVPVNPMEYLDPSTVLNLILTQNTSLNTPVIGLATSLLVVSAPGVASVVAGKRRVSFLNSGNFDASVNGTILSKGIGITYSADGLRDVLAAIPYDALTSELVITTVG